MTVQYQEIILIACAVIIGATLLFVGFGLFLVRRKDRRQDAETSGRVIGIIGKMGAGKTMHAVRMAVRRLEAGVDVASNFTLDLGVIGSKGRWAPITSLGDLEHIRNAVVIIDEAHLLAPSSHSKNFPMQARQALAFARKNGLDLFWISQHEERVNRTLRDLTTEYHFCTKGYKKGTFKVEVWEPEKFRKASATPDRRMLFKFDAKVAAAYDTTQVIQLDDHLAAVDQKERATAKAARQAQ